MQFKIPGYTCPTIANLKDFCSKHGIVPTGDKRNAQAWMDAIDTWAEFNEEAIALAVDDVNELEDAVVCVENPNLLRHYQQVIKEQIEDQAAGRLNHYLAVPHGHGTS